MIVTFVACLLAFVGVGALAVTRARQDTADYLVAGRSVGPWLAALSAVSTNNSGFMFVGLIGATFTAGLSSMWLMVGWIAGDWIAWRVVHRRLREGSEAMGATTIQAYLAAGPAGSDRRAVAALGSIIGAVLLGVYAAAQLNAGSKALHVLFGWPYATGAVVGACIIVVYCFAGGIRASIWTDAVQAVVMLASMALLLAVALGRTGGFAGLAEGLRAIDPQLMELTPPGLRFGFWPYMLGWLAAGIGVIGQPHIMIRAMTLERPEQMAVARRIYFAWYLLFTFAAVAVVLACRVLLPEVQGFDAELALPRLAQELLPPPVVGLILAGLFAATMSTADSQILSVSASVTQDFVPARRHSYLKVKAATLAAAGAALAIALLGPDSVFELVVIAWSALAASLGPLLLVRVRGGAPPAGVAMAMMLAGLSASLGWRYGLGLSGAVYEVLPGMVAGLGVWALARAFRSDQPR